MSRFFVKPENVGKKNIIIDDAQDLHHMIKVLRLSEGDEVEISDTKQWEYKSRLVYISSDMAEAEILDKQSFSAEPDIKLTLFQGIPKQGKMELIVQKTVELGVNEIFPVFMMRSVVTDNGKFGKKISRWQKVSDEAVKQCKRGLIPRVEKPLQLKDAVKLFHDFDLVLFPYENEEGTTIKDVLVPYSRRNESDIDVRKHDEEASCGKIAVIIGPEGGFSDEEAKMITEAGGISVSLGKTVLRTETAGMAAIAMIMYELEL